MAGSAQPRPSPRRQRKRRCADDTHTDDENNSPAKKSAPDRPPQHDYHDVVARMDAAMLSDYLAKTLQRHTAGHSAIELEDQFIPAGVIRDTSSFATPRVSKHLPAFLEAVSGGREELASCTDVASPHTIVVTSSGIRAADLARELRTFATDDVKVAKLFAKHMKLQANIAFVQKTKIGIGVGTPVRLKELVEHDALQAAAIRRIVIDGSYVDEKKRTIFDMREIYVPLLELLNLDKIKSRREAQIGGLEIVIF